MPLLVVFVTAQSDVIDAISDKKSSLIPSNFRENGFSLFGGEEIVISGFEVASSAKISELYDYLYKKDVMNASGVIVLTDESLPRLVETLGHIFSVNRFQLPDYGKSIANALQATLAKCLRTFIHFRRRFNDLKYQNIIRLPLRNFDAEEITLMRRICSDMMNRENFGREFDAALGRLRRRRHPKKTSTRPYTYYVDDDDNHFRLGFEIHAHAETASPPHNAECVLANIFRFGGSFDGTKHFNVSREGDVRMTGNSTDCHDVSRSENNVTHLNMFTNDFF